jgi:hypothetical protein
MPAAPPWGGYIPDSARRSQASLTQSAKVKSGKRSRSIRQRDLYCSSLSGSTLTEIAARGFGCVLLAAIRHAMVCQ